MMQKEEAKKDVLEHIPDPGTVRQRLKTTLEETQVLRKLLTVSERAAKLREERKEPVHA